MKINKKISKTQYANDNLINSKYFLVIINELIDLLEYENHLILDNQIARIKNIIPRKNELINFIDTLKSNISINSDFFLDLSDDYKKELLVLARKLQELTEVNQKQLSKEIFFKQEVIKTVSDLIKEQLNSSCYDKQGKFNSTNIKNNPPSITLNDKI